MVDVGGCNSRSAEQKKAALEKHMETCASFDVSLNTTMPTEGSCKRFQNWHKTIKHPIGVYCDFEAFNTEVRDTDEKLRKDVVSELLQTGHFGTLHSGNHPLSRV